MLCIKAVLILNRNAVRDYLDFVVMYVRMGESAVADALQSFDRYYPQQNGQSALQQSLAQLANAMPYDLKQTQLSEYKMLTVRWHDWRVVKGTCAKCAATMFDRMKLPPQIARAKKWLLCVRHSARATQSVCPS